MPRPTLLLTWWIAIRPKTLFAALAPVVLGWAIAAHLGRFQPGPAGATLLGALLLQVASNLANDVFDYEKGADGKERTGPLRVVSAGWLSPDAVRWGLLTTLLASLGVGAYLVAVGGWPILIVGLASIVAAVAYTGGPWPLAYLGAGDLFVFVFFGPIAVIGTVFLQMGQVPPLATLLSLPIGGLVTNILVVNNLRDRVNDERANKRTLVVRFGESFALAEYGGFQALALALPLILVLTGTLGHEGLLPLLSAPSAVLLFRRIAKERGPALNRRLAQTAAYSLAYSLILALGIVLS